MRRRGLIGSGVAALIGLAAVQPALAAPPTSAPGDSAPPGDSAGGSVETCAPDLLEATSLRIATSPPSFDTLTDAYWLDLMAANGLDVETFEFETSPDTVRAVAAGEGDLVSTSPLAIMQYIQESGGGLQVIGVYLLKTDYVLVATPDVESLEDLSDGIIGISEPGDLSDSLTRLLFETAGVDVSNATFAEIGGTGARIAALADGQIQAGAAHAADGLAAAEEFGLNVLEYYADYIPDYAQRFLAATPDWLAENPNTAQCMVDLMIESQRWAAENRDEFIALGLERVEGLPENIAEQVYDLFVEWGVFAVDGGMHTVESTMQVEVDQGHLDAEGPMLDLDSWVDTTYVDDYLERVGPYEG